MPNAAPPLATAPASRGKADLWARWVPIRSLKERHRPRILAHLLALKPEDRYLRFGYVASDAQIRAYVQGLRFGHDQLLGIFNRRLELIAMAHLALATQLRAIHQAEFGVSVQAHTRGRGYGGRLFARAMVQARNQGVTHLIVHALSENAPMIRIAQRAGAEVERHGSESEAMLRLPPADFDSHVSELLLDQAALADYHWKAQLYRRAGLRPLWERCLRWWRQWRQH